MKALVLNRIVSLNQCSKPLTLVDIPVPQPTAGEVLLRVSACGVCHTELDEIEGRTPPPRLPVVPGHEVVGRISELGPGVTRVGVGDRVGVGWIFSSSGEEDENLSRHFCATGRDVNGGYAEFMVAARRLHLSDSRRLFGRPGRSSAVCRGHRIPGTPADGTPRW